MTKRFMWVCMGVLMLAVAYHLVQPVNVAQSQEGERPVLMASYGSSRVIVMTDLGNLYSWSGPDTWAHMGTWPGYPPTLTQPTTWGKIKAEFAE